MAVRRHCCGSLWVPLECAQEDGCFTLVCGDRSLCLCLAKCQQVSRSEIWQGRRRVLLHILLPRCCVTDLHPTLPHCNAAVIVLTCSTSCGNQAKRLWCSDEVRYLPLIILTLRGAISSILFAEVQFQDALFVLPLYTFSCKLLVMYLHLS